MLPLVPFVAQLNVILSRDMAGDPVRCPIVARRLINLLWPGWLPAEAKAYGKESYGRHLLHEDPAGRFSIGSFVWRPGEATPIHDHHCWGVVGVAQGRLVSQDFQASADGRSGLRHVTSVIIPTGHTTWLSPGTGDIPGNQHSRLRRRVLCRMPEPLRKPCRYRRRIPSVGCCPQRLLNEKRPRRRNSS